MAENLKFDSGDISLAVQGDPSRILIFNPKDFNLSKKFFELVQSAEEKSKEFARRAKEADESEDVSAKFELLSDMDKFFRKELDKLFGAGSADMIFGSANVISQGKNGDFLLTNFLMALYPYFEKESKAKVQKIIADHKPGKKKKNR